MFHSKLMETIEVEHLNSATDEFTCEITSLYLTSTEPFFLVLTNLSQFKHFFLQKFIFPHISICNAGPTDTIIQYILPSRLQFYLPIAFPNSEYIYF